MRSIKPDLPAHWVLPISIILFLIILSGFEYQVLQYTSGMFIYPLDDAYVRMSIARNLSANGTWGLNPGEFSPGSSSVLYPLLLAAFYRFIGPQVIVSFLINVVAAIVLLIVTHRWLRRQDISPFTQLLILVALIIFIPLPVLVAIGMEHVLQALFSFLFLYGFCEWLSDREKKRNMFLKLLIWAFLLTAIRYEGIFFLLTTVVFLLIRKRWLGALLLLLAGVLPVVLFGVYSLRQGGYFLPSSILLRAMPVPLNSATIQNFLTTDLFNKFLYTFPTRPSLATERLLVIVPLFYCVFIGALRQNPVYRRLLLFCIIITAMHIAFANDLLFYRHEAYLFAGVCPVMGVLLARSGKSMVPVKGASIRWVSLFFLIILLLPSLIRSWQAYKDTGVRSLNMYEQDCQVADFLKQYYNNVAVVVSDPGAVSFGGNGRKVDLVDGIASMDVTRAREEDYYRPLYQGFLAEKAHPLIAAVNERKYSPYLYEKWIKVAAWGTRNVPIMGAPHISFYALHASDTSQLRRDLEAFQKRLPAGVKVTYE